MKLPSAIKYLVVLFLFVGMSCEETIIDQTLSIDKESSFRINQLYTSSDGRYTFRITEISDSRCPEGVVCIWQGEVSLKGEWNVNQSKTAVELHTVLKDAEKQPDGFTIEIIDSKPYPKFGTESKPEDLVIILLIKEKSKLDEISFSHSMKGWELYSWPNGNDWNYSILIGTNRSKTYDEVVTNKATVIGKDSLKMLLDKFPAKEELFWIGKGTATGWENLSFPDANTINEIKSYCVQKELVLNVFN